MRFTTFVNNFKNLSRTSIYPAKIHFVTRPALTGKINIFRVFIKIKKYYFHLLIRIFRNINHLMRSLFRVKQMQIIRVDIFFPGHREFISLQRRTRLCQMVNQISLSHIPAILSQSIEHLGIPRPGN